MTYPPERWAYVGLNVHNQMAAKAMSQADLARASGVSDFTVRKVMRGEPGNYRPDRLAKIAVALGWTPDSFDRMLAGEEVEPLVTGDLDERLSVVEADLREIRSAVEFLVREAEKRGEP